MLDHYHMIFCKKYASCITFPSNCSAIIYSEYKVISEGEFRFDDLVTHLLQYGRKIGKVLQFF